jgi:hypothetical protein
MLEQLSKALPGIPPGGLVALAVLLVVQLALQVVCLIDLARRRQVRLERKWLWLFVIVFGQLAGAIVYLAVARSPVTVEDRPSPVEATGQRARRALDVLYGRNEEDPR